MGATYKGDTIYISKDLAAKLTPQERKVLLAHEIAHWKHKDHIWLGLAKLFLPMFANRIKLYLETRADKWAINKTKDPSACLSLIEKLNRDNTYPSREESLNLIGA